MYLLVIPALALVLPAFSQPAVVINEFLASNNDNISDEDGDFEDWIEILNTGSTSVNLNGYGLSDREGDDYRWIFPDTTIEPGEFMLIWASGKDRRVSGKPLHTGFRISADGEPLRLTDPGNREYDAVSPVAVPTDYSYGRKPDGSDNWAFFREPTPGAPNTTSGLERLLGLPIFDKPGGFYPSERELTLSLPPGAGGAEIYYTTDGSEPGPDNGTRYTGPIQLNDRTDQPNDLSMIRTNSIGEDDPLNDGWKPPDGQVFKGTVVRAVTVADQAEPIGIATQTYFIGNDLSQRYRLPVVSLATHRDHFFSESDGIYAHGNYWNRTIAWERPVHFEFYEPGGNHVFSQDAGVRIHGGTSRARPIKSLRLYARRDYGEAWFDYPLIPDAPVDRYKRFLLRNSGNDWDKSFFRDALMQKLMEHTGVETQYYQPVVVFLNGEYWGLHNLRKRYDHRYFESMYGIEREDLVMLEGNAELKEGNESDRAAYEDLRDLIDSGSIHHSDSEEWDEITGLIELDNFRDYQIANIYYRNTDWPGNNIDFWRKRTNGPQDEAPKGHDGRWRWLMYDTDFGFNLDYDYVQGADERARHNTLAFAIDGSHHHWPNPQWSVAMLRGALRNPEFKNDFINRFADLLNSAFSEERVLEEIASMYDVLKPHMKEHIRRWRGPETMQEWEGQVELMRDFARERPAAQREHIRRFFELSGLYDLELDVSHPDAGYITVHSLDVKPGGVGIADDPWPWTGSYFREVPLTITAHPSEGVDFVGWEGSDEMGSTIEVNPHEGNLSVKAIFTGDGLAADDGREDRDRPAAFRVDAPRPNPFNHQTMLTVFLPEEQHVRLTVYSVDGRRIGVLHDSSLQYGTHTLRINASGWASGVYITVLEAGPYRKTFPVTLIK